MSALPRFTRLLVLVGIMSVAVSAAPGVAFAERVTATLTFADGNGDRSPIRRATVEIWRKYGFFGTWHNDFTVTTDESGRINANVPTVGAGAEYGLRVYAINDAAIVRFRDRPTDAMYSEPGPPGAPIRKVSNGASDVLDFSFDFTDLATVAYYNAADALIYGRDYALARRAPGEPEPIKQLNVMVQSGNTFYDPAVHWMRINPGYLFTKDDLTVLHEYAHFLEEQLSTFGPAIATWHDGCNAQLGQGGAHVESMDFAWMEGFADYYAQAVARAFNTDPLKPKLTGPADGTSSVATLEGPSCPFGPSLPGEWLEDFVAGALWDLTDVSTRPEPADRLCNQDGAIFSIFDRELQRVPANIQSFTDAWVARRLDVPPLRSAFAAQGVSVTTPAPQSFFSPAAAAELAVWRGSEAGAWYILGGSGPHWGAPGDVPVPADYDGDGRTDAAVWRPSTGEWFALLSGSGGLSQVTQWGLPSDIPLPGDYDGDGETDFAVYRASQNAVLVRNDSCAEPGVIDLSSLGVGRPIVGDVDGDGVDDPGLYNASTGTLRVRRRAQPPLETALATNAVPVLADYDGDGKDDLATYTPTQRWLFGGITIAGDWTIWRSTDGAVITPIWGPNLGDTPVPADYDGDGTADLAVWNNRTGYWTIREANGSARVVQWGQAGDIPIPR